MLLVVKAGREAEVERIFEKWDLHASKIGQVTSDGLLRVRHHGELVAEIPNRALTDEAPVYRRPMEVPAYLTDTQALDLEALARRPTVRSSSDALLALLGSPNIASKQWVFCQYDHMVQTNTAVLPGRGAGVLRIKGTERALAMSLDGNSRYCYLDPRRGAMLAVAEAARNVACAGARPLGATNCLNFGNPERPPTMWQFAQAVEGIGEACRALSVPITGGNVSLYNETDGRPIFPTPILGVVGLIAHAERALDRRFRGSGDAIVLLGTHRGELGGSEYLARIHGLIAGRPPGLDLKAERALQALMVDLADQRLVRSAHDCSDGGLAVAIAECCFDTGGIGARVSLEPTAVVRDLALDEAAILFGESASRIVVSTISDRLDAVLERGKAAGVPAQVIGQTGGDRLTLTVGGRVAVDVLLAEAERVWSASIPHRMGRRVA